MKYTFGEAKERIDDEAKSVEIAEKMPYFTCTIGPYFREKSNFEP
jgi:hypothetical protein